MKIKPFGRPSCVNSFNKDCPSTECLADIVRMYCKARIDAFKSPLSKISTITIEISQNVILPNLSPTNFCASLN